MIVVEFWVINPSCAMRFKAKIIQISCIQQLIKVLGTVSKVAKTCVVCLSQTQISFILTERLASGGASFWCELSQENFFDEYRIEGKDSRNEIYFEIIVDSFVRAMRSAQSAQAVKIRLAKKQTACLVFEITLPSLTHHTRSVVHNVPVNIIPSRFWDDYQRKQVDTYDVSLTLPNLKTIKSVVERFKNMSGFMSAATLSRDRTVLNMENIMFTSVSIMAANSAGQFLLQIQTDEATVTTNFKGSDMNQSMYQESQVENLPMIEVRVEVQKVVTFLQGQQSILLRPQCNMIDGQAVHFLFEGDGISFHYHLPGIML